MHLKKIVSILNSKLHVRIDNPDLPHFFVHNATNKDIFARNRLPLHSIISIHFLRNFSFPYSRNNKEI